MTKMNLSEYYADKPPGYFTEAKQQVVDLIDGNNHRILELGCAEGHTSALLKSLGKAREVHGVELVPEIAERARSRLDSVITGDLETVTFPFEAGSFDYVVATEVLEHLRDPWALLRRLAPLLQPDGYVVASSPNMRHVRVLWNLVARGEWRYERSGPLDRTHLRFFTKRSFARLFEESGYAVDTMRPVFLRKAARITKLTLNQFEEFLSVQYFCKAHVNHPAGSA
ncbi:MAG: class I SAM-dependent methyltransferase [Anaerolineae bacterium]